MEPSTNPPFPPLPASSVNAGLFPTMGEHAERIIKMRQENSELRYRVTTQEAMILDLTRRALTSERDLAVARLDRQVLLQLIPQQILEATALSRRLTWTNVAMSITALATLVLFCAGGGQIIYDAGSAVISGGEKLVSTFGGAL